jgi:hypothetical protein
MSQHSTNATAVVPFDCPRTEVLRPEYGKRSRLVKHPVEIGGARHIIAEIVHLIGYRFLRSTIDRQPELFELMQI